MAFADRSYLLPDTTRVEVNEVIINIIVWMDIQDTATVHIILFSRQMLLYYTGALVNVSVGFIVTLLLQTVLYAVFVKETQGQPPVQYS